MKKTRRRFQHHDGNALLVVESTKHAIHILTRAMHMPLTFIFLIILSICQKTQIAPILLHDNQKNPYETTKSSPRQILIF